jgi:hypothetical protein
MMDWAPPVVYVLCTLTCVACAALLWRGYVRSKARLLLWSALCFAALTMNNVFLFLDKVVWPERTDLFGIEFPLLRVICAVVGVGVLLFGLVWDAE